MRSKTEPRVQSARSRRAVERYSSEQAATQEENAFLAALADGRDPPLRPTIMDIEAHAVELATPIPGGVVPMLILLAARRRGEFATAVAPRFLAHPVTVALVAGLYVAGLLFQGWVISHDPLMRIGTLAAAIVVGAICGAGPAVRRVPAAEPSWSSAERTPVASATRSSTQVIRLPCGRPCPRRDAAFAQVGWLETRRPLDRHVPRSRRSRFRRSPRVGPPRHRRRRLAAARADASRRGDAEAPRSIELATSRATLAPRRGPASSPFARRDGIERTAGRAGERTRWIVGRARQAARGIRGDQHDRRRRRLPPRRRPAETSDQARVAELEAELAKQTRTASMNAALYKIAAMAAAADDMLVVLPGPPRNPVGAARRREHVRGALRRGAARHQLAVLSRLGGHRSCRIRARGSPWESSRARARPHTSCGPAGFSTRPTRA